MIIDWNKPPDNQQSSSNDIAPLKQSFLQKAGSAIGGFTTGVAKSVVNTADVMSTEGQQAMQWMGKGVTAVTGRKPLVNTVAKVPGKFTQATNTAQKIGKTVGDVAQYFIPVGGEEKAASLLPESAIQASRFAKPAAKAIGSAIEYGGKTFLQTGSGKESGKAALTAGVLTEFGAALGKVLAPFKGSYLPKVASEFEKQGIQAPVSAVTKSPFLKGAEALLSKGLFGRSIIEETTKTLNAIAERTSSIIETVKPVKVVSDENLGKTIQEGLANYEKDFKLSSNKVYETFSGMFGKTKAVVENTVPTVKKIIGEQSKDLFKGVDPGIARLVENISSSPGKAKVFTFENLKSTRTAIGEALGKSPENSALKRIYGALTEDMHSTIASVDEHAGSVLNSITEAYKSGKSKIESNIASSIEKSNPERIAQNLITRNSADTLKTVKEMIGEKPFAEISKSFTRKLFDDSTGKLGFDITKLEKNIAKYDTNTLNEILSPEQKKLLDDSIVQLKKLQSLKDAMKSGEKMAQGSQTAFLQNITRTYAQAGAFVTALVTGKIGVAMGILGEAGLEAAGTKVFTSDAGKKLLTEGLELPPTIGKTLKNVTRVGGVSAVTLPRKEQP